MSRTSGATVSLTMGVQDLMIIEKILDRWAERGNGVAEQYERFRIRTIILTGEDPMGRKR